VLLTVGASVVLAARGVRRPDALRPWLIGGWVALLPATIFLIAGIGSAGPLPAVAPRLWGGLLLTLMLTIIGNTLAFPLGVLLALGRRSQLPVIRAFSIGYIELIRGVPLVTILFMANIMLPLFLSADIRVDSVVRAIIGLTLFEAAYQAENVRGGLQAIPRGQVEAASALGLNGLLTTGFIVLPQAIRLVVPALINSFISLFKDTSLVSLLGLFDLMLIGKTTLAQPEFLGRYREVYLFLFVVYWAFSLVFSYASQRLEQALGIGHR
jgi:general L-amino acid transport system permease protein